MGFVIVSYYRVGCLYISTQVVFIDIVWLINMLYLVNGWLNDISLYLINKYMYIYTHIYICIFINIYLLQQDIIYICLLPIDHFPKHTRSCSEAGCKCLDFKAARKPQKREAAERVQILSLEPFIFEASGYSWPPWLNYLEVEVVQLMVNCWFGAFSGLGF